jgi:phosphatidylglycerol---prolipoprotein diacylglyceryl transferase
MYPIIRMGSFAISSYTVMMIIGFIVAYRLCEGEFKRKGLGGDLLDWVFVASIIGGLVGAKILFLLENVTFSEFVADPVRYLSSGLTYLGGFVGAAVLFLIVTRIKKVNFWLATDAMAPIVITYAIARIGCFLVGDDYGIPSNLPWAMAFPNGSPPTNERVHPTQIYEILLTLGIFVYVWKIRKKNMPIGWLSAIILMLTGAERFLVEFVRHTTPSFIPGISLAQLMSLGLIIVGVLKLVQIKVQARKFTEPIKA